jgi:hypothetical protein
MSALKTIVGRRWLPLAGALLLAAASAIACLDFYDRIPCDSEDNCPYGYRCDGVCKGPGEDCTNDSDCDQYEAVKNHRDLLCVRMPWESDHTCRLSCSPGTTSNETSCPPGQECRALSDGTSLGACF